MNAYEKRSMFSNPATAYLMFAAAVFVAFVGLPAADRLLHHFEVATLNPYNRPNTAQAIRPYVVFGCFFLPLVLNTIGIFSALCVCDKKWRAISVVALVANVAFLLAWIMTGFYSFTKSPL